MKKKWLLLLIYLILPIILFAWQVKLKRERATQRVVAEVNRVSNAFIAFNDDLYHFEIQSPDAGINYALIRHCMAQGADLDSLPDHGADLFKRAFILQDYDLLKLLQANGTPVDLDTQLFLTICEAVSENGRRSLIFGENNKYAARLKTLLRSGANPNARDLTGDPVLFWTALVRTDLGKHMIDALVKAGADINARSRSGFTLLMTALSPENPDLIEVLLARHVDVLAKTGRGDSALTIAQERKSSLSAITLQRLYAEAHRQKLALLQSQAKVTQ